MMMRMTSLEIWIGDLNGDEGQLITVQPSATGQSVFQDESLTIQLCMRQAKRKAAEEEEFRGDMRSSRNSLRESGVG